METIEQQPSALPQDDTKYIKLDDSALSEKILSQLSQLSISPNIFLECVNNYLAERNTEQHEKKKLSIASAERIILDLKSKLEKELKEKNRELLILLMDFLEENNMLDKRIELPPEEIDTQPEERMTPAKGTPEYDQMMREAFHHEKENLPPAGHKEDEI